MANSSHLKGLTYLVILAVTRGKADATAGAERKGAGSYLLDGVEQVEGGGDPWPAGSRGSSPGAAPAPGASWPCSRWSSQGRGSEASQRIYQWNVKYLFKSIYLN